MQLNYLIECECKQLRCSLLQISRILMADLACQLVADTEDKQEKEKEEGTDGQKSLKKLGMLKYL